MSINCTGVLYNVSGSAITLPNIKKNGDCVHDKLAKYKLGIKSITYDSAKDTILVRVKKAIATIKFLLTHVGGTQSEMALEKPNATSAL